MLDTMVASTSDIANNIANDFFGRGSPDSGSDAAIKAAESIANLGQTSGFSTEYVVGLIVGIIMSSLGFYFIKKAKREGSLVYLATGIPMAALPFFVMNPYVLTPVFIVCLGAIWVLER